MGTFRVMSSSMLSGATCDGFGWLDWLISYPFPCVILEAVRAEGQIIASSATRGLALST